MPESLYKPTGIRDVVDAQGRPFHAYHGSNPYIFISYAHRNADLVYPVIENLFLKGYNVWYDEGIPNFSDLEAEIKRHIEGCSRFVMFASQKSLSSPYVQIEITHAYEHQKQIICVELEPVKAMAQSSDLQVKLKDCVFISPEQLLKTLPGDCRDAASREPDSFEPEQTGGRLEPLSPMSDYLFELENGGITLKKCTIPDADKKEVMELPSSHEGYLVRKTEGTFYYYWPALRSVKLPDSLTEIGDGTFCGCRSLASISLPQGLQVIGNNAFGVCSALSAIKIPPSVKKIGRDAFHSTSLTAVLLPYGIEKIEPKTFQSCARLSQLVVPAGVTAIGEMAFLDCTALREVIIPETVIEIGTEAFSGCKGCTVVCVKNSAAHRYVKENPYYQLNAKPVSGGELQNLMKKYYPTLSTAAPVFTGRASPAPAPAWVSELESDRKEYAYFSVTDSDYSRISTMLRNFFDKGYNLVVSGKDPEKNTKLIRDCNTFIPLLSKGSVSLPQFSKECAFAFSEHCDYYPIALDDGVTLPNELSQEFAGKFILHRSDRTESDFLNELMNHLTDRACRGTARTAAERMLQLQNEAFEYATTEEGVVITAYRGKEGGVVVPSELYGKPVAVVGEKAFFGHSGITSVSIPDGIRKIEFCSFYGCASLQEVLMPDSITEIGVSAFCECLKMPSIQLSDHLKVIRNEAFSGCSGLLEITIPDSVVELGDRVFSQCTSLKRAFVSRNLKTLEVNTFTDCSSLSEIELPEGLLEIKAAAFRGCKALKRINIPNSVIFIGMGAFDGCSLFLKVTGNTSVYKEYLRDYKEFKKQLKS